MATVLGLEERGGRGEGEGEGGGRGGEGRGGERGGGRVERQVSYHQLHVQRSDLREVNIKTVTHSHILGPTHTQILPCRCEEKVVGVDSLGM